MARLQMHEGILMDPMLAELLVRPGSQSISKMLMTKKNDKNLPPSPELLVALLTQHQR